MGSEEVAKFGDILSEISDALVPFEGKSKYTDQKFL